MLPFLVMLLQEELSMTFDMALMHLMCAKICHDLSAPASAVAMGLEMLCETPQDTSTLELVTYSSQSTIHKLELFRCLTGFSSTPSKPTGIDLEKALRNYWPDNKISITWKVPQLENIQGPPARLLLATLLTAADSLPRGGTLTIDPNLSITAKGPTALLWEETVKALTGSSALSQQTVGTIVAFFAHTLAHSLGKKLTLQTINESQFQVDIVEK